MRIDGLWGVEFFANTDQSGSGVIAFQNGQCFGGDTQYYYFGKYTLANDTIAVNLRVSHFHGEPSSIFGPIKHFHLSITARISEPWIMGQGQVAEIPYQRLSFRLKRLEYLSGEKDR